ncbi:hypothetical protein Q604_UNBC03327G0002, partial [human gut metagenome]
GHRGRIILCVRLPAAPSAAEGVPTKGLVMTIKKGVSLYSLQDAYGRGGLGFDVAPK